MIYRLMNAADAGQAEALTRLISHSSLWTETAYKQLLNDGAGFGLVAEAATAGTAKTNRLMGFLVGRVTSGDAEILNFAVEPSERRLGIGSALIAEAIEHLRAKGIQRLFLEVRDSNVAARALYAKQGFREVGRRRRYYRDPDEDAVILGKEVDQ
jgi:[ribosomal protein S18]-alanine N-acetyltransferase